MKALAEITNIGFTEHYKSEGVYCRVLHIKAGDLVVGALHLTTHISVLLVGEISIGIGNEVKRFKAPYIFEALKGSRKVAIAHTDCQIMNIIPTNLDTIEEIEKEVVDMTIPKDIELLLQPFKLLKGE